MRLSPVLYCRSRTILHGRAGERSHQHGTQCLTTPSQQTDAAITAALNTALARLLDHSADEPPPSQPAVANYYTKQEVDALIANFITKSVNDLVNYYLKSDTIFEGRGEPADR